MKVLVCGGGTFLDSPSQFSSHSHPITPYWSSAVETWRPDDINVSITWQGAILTKKSTASDSHSDDENILLFGDIANVKEQQQGIDWKSVRCLTTAGIFSCFITVNRSEEKTTVRAALIGRGKDDAVSWFDLPLEMQHLQKIAMSIVDSRLSSPVLYGVCQDQRAVKMTLVNGEFALCTTPSVLADERFSEISAGREHVLFLNSKGEVFSVGLSSRGQLGHGDLDAVEEPNLVEAFLDIQISQISAGGWSSMALSDRGLVFVWGWNSGGALGFPNRAVREQIGYVPDNASTHSKEPVELLAEPKFLPLPEKIGWISCGERHAGAVSESGKVFLWGLNQHGQLGLKDEINRDFPFLLKDVFSVSRIECSEWTTIFLLDDNAKN